MPIGMCITVFLSVFRSFLFLVTRQPTQASRFLMITRVVARISGLLSSGVSCKDRIKGFVLLGAQSTFLYYCCRRVNFTSNYNM